MHTFEITAGTAPTLNFFRLEDGTNRHIATMVLTDPAAPAKEIGERVCRALDRGMGEGRP